MGNRLSKIYTRTGDDGTTGLGDGNRVAKSSLRVEAYGTVDEANSTIGMVLACASVPDDIRHCLTEVQHDLFDLGGELSIPGHVAIGDGHVTRLETLLDGFNADLPALKEFILPGGSRAAAFCHLARTACRRAERRVVSLTAAEQTAPPLQRYLNRLSDLLFVLCRVVNRDAGITDVYWQKGRNRGQSG